MEINLTFIVQIFHFWFAYYLLSRFLLKPFVYEHFKKKQLKLAAIHAMQQQERDLNDLIEQKNRALVDFKEQMKSQVSYQHQSGDESEPSVVAPVSMEFVPEQGVDFLVQRVVDAYRD